MDVPCFNSYTCTKLMIEIKHMIEINFQLAVYHVINERERVAASYFGNGVMRRKP